MAWENKATYMALRLGKREGDTFYEIRPLCRETGFIVESESLSEGKRLGMFKKSAGELLKQFPDLEEWKPLLYAYQQISERDVRIISLKKVIDELREVMEE